MMMMIMMDLFNELLIDEDQQRRGKQIMTKSRRRYSYTKITVYLLRRERETIELRAFTTDTSSQLNIFWHDLNINVHLFSNEFSSQLTVTRLA